MLCELVQVQWVEEDRAGVAFLRMSLENEVGCTDSAAISSHPSPGTRFSQNILQMCLSSTSRPVSPPVLAVRSL